tara:strand:+ start:454 stop:687 length:234 start_codon:yes stop_codon:yes gene_type:complete
MTKKLFFLFTLFLFNTKIFALCSTCKAVVENNDGEWGNGLNDGIFFLMIPPYILLLIIVLVVFKGKIKAGFKSFVNS